MILNKKVFLCNGDILNHKGKELIDVQKSIDESICQLIPEFYYEPSDGGNIFYNFICIPKQCKAKIKKELCLLGITEGFVYPEIESQSNALLEQL